jgi:hypothetical protein
VKKKAGKQNSEKLRHNINPANLEFNSHTVLLKNERKIILSLNQKFRAFIDNRPTTKKH